MLALRASCPLLLKLSAWPALWATRSCCALGRCQVCWPRVKIFQHMDVSWRACGLVGLPNDAQSADNAHIVFASRRWPLFIDPQRQARNWVIGIESANSLQVVAADAPDLLSKLAAAVEAGLPVLIEGMREQVDQALDPLLLRQVPPRRT